jgi:hypothetical protein
MPRLRELTLEGILTLSIQFRFIWMTGQAMDDERFMAIAEGLSALNTLEKLGLPGSGSLPPLSANSCDQVAV